MSAILLTPTSLDEVPFLEPQHFYADANRLIYAAARALRDRGNAVDIVTVAGYLRDTERLQFVGGSPYLAQLSDATPAVAHLEEHARRIVEKWELRQVIIAAQTIAAEGYGEVGNPEEWKQSVDQRIYNATRSLKREESLVILADATRDAILAIQARQNSKGPIINGVTTGLPTLDARLGGLEGGRVYVVAARPGQGKTSCATGMALACAAPPRGKSESVGDGVVFISVEMPRKQIAMRVLSQIARIDSNRLARRNLEADEWRRLTEAQERVQRMPIVIEDASNHSPSSIRSAMRMGSRRLKDRFGSDVKVRVGAIDYLQLLSSHDHSNNREQEIGNISRAIKSIAKDENVAMISLAQVNRECEKRKPPIPQLSDLRESGSIEQDADVVMFLYREDYYRPKDDIMDNKAQIIVAKWRDGATGVVRCEFDPSTTTFFETSKNPDLEQLGDLFDDYLPGTYNETAGTEPPRNWQDGYDD